MAKINSFLIVTGLSGAGKSTAQACLSDLGYYTVDNLPVPLCENFLSYVETQDHAHGNVALLVDISSSEQRKKFAEFMESERLQSIKTELIFLDCATETLIKRYSETRRPHPHFDAKRDTSLEDTINRERSRLTAIMEKADFRIDTTSMNVHQLKRVLKEFVDKQVAPEHTGVRVNFLSFGFKHGLPRDCDLVIDVRFLPNPYFVEELRSQNGLDKPVRDYILAREEAKTFLERYSDLLHYLLPLYAQEGKAYLNIGVGCTGGQHRSVAIAEELATRMPQEGFHISAKHRDMR